jgi:hypothetical protein
VKLVYDEAELLREPAYAAPHEAAGRRLHGGFDAAGHYLSPRSAIRDGAVQAWQDALLSRGGTLLDTDPRRLLSPPYPSFAQQKLLLEHGLGQTLWNTLTITGVIEARGRLLCGFTMPDLQPFVEDDLTQTATGHLNRGLLRAHGLDEGGDGARGGHDAMWFAVRDLVFGAGRWPDPVIPPRIGRPDEDRALLPWLPLGHERALLLLMNVLLIEIRAESVFGFVLALLADPALFPDRRNGAAAALALVERIRQDERIHVDYLRTTLSELRHVRWRGRDGVRREGREVIDPVWSTLVHWHTVENPRLARPQQIEVLRARILAHPDGEALLARFAALEADAAAA